MTLNDLPLNELLRRAAVEVDAEKLKSLIHEISQRYVEQDRHMVFDIFSGVEDKNAVWMEAVVGLHAANARMQQIGADDPGSYFVFHSQSRRVMARLDNTSSKPVEARKSAKTGTA